MNNENVHDSLSQKTLVCNENADFVNTRANLDP